MSRETDTLKALYKTLKTTQKRLDDLERALREPIAVIGMACRFPGGAENIEGYRALLEEGRDGICDVPSDRWDGARYYDPDPAVPGKTQTNRAGFLREPIDRFDSAFFHLSPLEAASMDPQQRMLIEVCWEAFEHAGVDPETFKGTRTGVFCGIANSDYAAAHLRSGDPLRIDGYSVTGSALSAAVGRLSYLFGFEGPNMALDTACSSSLVAVHLACRSLRSGESDAAVAGGINLILTPEGHIGFSKLRALSPDGRCKSFDDAADGYGRGEGCGLVVLKRLSDARRDNDPVWALVRGSAVNQDGRTNGFTAPSSLAQEKVLRAALADAALQPGDIGYLEAHGTGTPLGDPIEMEAIGKVYGTGRDGNAPLYVGSAKANIGHLEAAAGIASLLKAVLMVGNGSIFPQIHFHTPNRHIPWQGLAVKIARESLPWLSGTSPRGAAVSSFGFSGTNAHVILQEALPEEVKKGDLTKGPVNDRSHHLLTLSARDPEALRALAIRYRDHLSATGDAIGDICYTAATGRRPFSHRLAVVGRNTDDLRAALEAHLEGKAPERVYRGDCAEKGDRRICFLFTGQGSQYPGMGADLYRTSPVFRQELDRCAGLLKPHMDWSLTDLLYGRGGDQELRETIHSQPVIFSVEYALAKLLESWGIRPSLVMGHSIGEYVAATLAGIFELEEALSLVVNRGRLIGSLPQDGLMAVISAGEEAVREAMGALPGRVSIAAVNAPRNTVISGERGAVENICARFRKKKTASHILNVSHAFHSCLLDPVIERFGALAADLRYRPPQLPIIATVTGRTGGAEMATPRYWVDQLRSPVRFYDAMRAIAREGYGIFLEVGATSTLTSLARQCLPEHDALWLATLGYRDAGANLNPRRQEGHSDWEPLLCGLAGLSAAGCAIDGEEFDRPYGRKRVSLPHYPFQRKKCWIDLPVLGERRPLPASPRLERGVALRMAPAPAPAPAAALLPEAGTGRDGDGVRGRQLELLRRQLHIISQQLASRGAKGSGPLQELLDRQASLIRDMHQDREKETER